MLVNKLYEDNFIILKQYKDKDGHYVNGVIKRGGGTIALTTFDRDYQIEILNHLIGVINGTSN